MKQKKQAHGHLVVILPKDKIAEFERRFDPSQDDSFPQAQIKLLRSAKREDDPSLRQREYEIECWRSLQDSIIDAPYWSNRISLEELCQQLDVEVLEITSINESEQFLEKINCTQNCDMEYEWQAYYAGANWNENGWEEEELSDDEEMC